MITIETPGETLIFGALVRYYKLPHMMIFSNDAIIEAAGRTLTVEQMVSVYELLKDRKRADAIARICGYRYNGNAFSRWTASNIWNAFGDERHAKTIWYGGWDND